MIAILCDIIALASCRSIPLSKVGSTSRTFYTGIEFELISVNIISQSNA